MSSRNPADLLPCLLLADDDAGVLASGKMLFEDEGWRVVTAGSVAQILKEIAEGHFDAALVDMNYARDTTSGAEGLELISRISELDPDLPVIMMTAWATIPLAVEAVKRGARDFISKPWDNERVLQLLGQVARNTRAERRNRLLQEAVNLSGRDLLPSDFIAHSQPMREMIDVIRRIGPSTANVLLLGENGTGKSVVAKLIHDQSERAAGPFISVNMGGLSEGVFESEIFGHVRGAFTDAKADRAGRFELADGGTIFLDEIGNLSMPQQNRMLRLLETGEFERVGSSRTLRADVRIISATNADLQAMVTDKDFREDLFYRLNTVTLEMPPLRNRAEDVLPIAKLFLNELAGRYNKSISRIASDAQKALLAYPWPGNVREMRHAMERAVLMCTGSEIQLQHLMLSPAGNGSSLEKDFDSMSMEEVEQLLMQKALRKHSGNVTKAAKQLGMSRATFYRRMQDYRI